MTSNSRFTVLLLSIIIAMASLTETLGTAKAPRYSYNYSPPRIQSPYPQYPSYRAQTPDQNPSLPASILAQNQAQSVKPMPSLAFQAEYNYDPVLARISQFGDMTIANARTEAANLKKRAFIEAGDADITRELGADQNTIDAAAANPFSTKRLLEKDYTDRSRSLDEALNQQNLYYSGKRADDLVELERGRTKAYTDWSQVLRDLLSNIDTGVLTAEQNERNRALAEQAARSASSGRPVGSGGSAPAPPLDSGQPFAPYEGTAGGYGISPTFPNTPVPPSASPPSPPIYTALSPIPPLLYNDIDSMVLGRGGFRG